MNSIIIPFPLNWENKMAVPVEFPEHVTSDGAVLNKSNKKIDEVDNPCKLKSLSAEEEKLFQSMKHEINRLNSYSGKWPLNYLKPDDLAATGFFYLQSEDEVQCAFCHIIINKWTTGQKPLREHIKKSQKCPFLLSHNVGNVPIPRKNSMSNVQKTVPNYSMSNMSKPKHPKMAILRNRVLTYRDWPRVMFDKNQLAECGLYYTGVADIVTCFFCGGSLGNWELDDDPWVEHQKYFPDCSYIRRNKNYGKFNKVSHSPSYPEQSTSATSLNQSDPLPAELVHQPSMTEQSSSATSSNQSDPLCAEIVQQACTIFPKSLVKKVVSQYFTANGRKLSSLQELCEEILQHKDRENATKSHLQGLTTAEALSLECKSLNVSNGSAKSKEIKDPLMCKICMDQEMGIVFQPCGHLVSCPKCSALIFNCPLCRTPITNKVRTYLS